MTHEPDTHDVEELKAEVRMLREVVEIQKEPTTESPIRRVLEARKKRRAELDAARAEGVRAGLEAGAIASIGEGQGEWFNPVQAIRTLAADPEAVARIVAGMKGQGNE